MRLQSCESVAADAAPAGDAEGDGDARRARKRLPDIEEIDPALDAPAAAAETVPADGRSQRSAGPGDAEARRRGFRLGFGMVLVLVGVALFVYLHGRGAEAPAPALAAYVAQVDALRVAVSEGLDSLFRTLTAMISGNAES